MLDESGELRVNGTLRAGEILYPTYPAGDLVYPYTVPEGCLFLMGDNRTGSNDARFWNEPYISVDHIRARVMVGISVLPDNSWRGVRVIH